MTIASRVTAAIARIPIAQWPLVAVRVVDDEVRVMPRGALLAELRAGDLVELEHALRRVPPRPRAVVVFEVREIGVRLVECVIGRAAPNVLFANFEDTP